MYSDIETRGEMEKFFPEVECRAFMQRDRSVRIQDFTCDADFRRLSQKDSWTCFGEKGSPFGDISDVHSKEVPTYEECRWSVAMVTDVVLTQDTMEKRLKGGLFQFHKVIALKVKVGRNRRLWRIALATEKDFSRIVREGVELGYRFERVLPWTQ